MKKLAVAKDESCQKAKNRGHRLILNSALALLMGGFASISQAHESLILYGIVDTGLTHRVVKGADQKFTRTGMQDGGQNGSRWGMRGVHNIFPGLDAIFQLESGFTPSNGQMTRGLFHRQSTLGLRSDTWGTLEFGRQTSLSTKYWAAIDPFGLGFGQANVGVGFSAGNTQRFDNMVMYRTPSLGGLELGVNYSFNVDSLKAQETGFNTADNTRAIGVGLRYLQGPLNVTLTYDQLRASHQLTSAQRDASPRMFGIGSTYDFGAVKIAAGYARTADGWFISQSLGSGLPSEYSPVGGSDVFVDGFKANSYMLGVTIPVGTSHSIISSVQHIDPKNDKLTGGTKAMNIGSVAYTYDLSKRTNLYAYASYAKNWYFIDDIKSTAVGFGMRHRF